MRIACVSGWGQPADALAAIAPSATHVTYADQPSVTSALQAIATQARGHELLIGWSLGGQLALRAIATGLLRPKRLVLIATPFQFVQSASLPIGMPIDLFAKFKHNYAKNPQNTLKKAWELIALNDSNAQNVLNHLAKQDRDAVFAQNWGQWLQILENFSCKTLDTNDIPAPLLIHGDHDHVVYPNQAAQFKKLLPKARLEILPSCGHAPHWHNPEQVKTLIDNYV